MTSYNSLRWWQYRILEFQTLVCLDYVQQITGRQMSFSDRDGVSSWIRHLSATYVSLLCLPSEYSPKTCVQSCHVVQSLMAYMPWLLHLKKKKEKICDFSLVISERFSSAGWLLCSTLCIQLQVSSPNEPQITKISESHLVSIQNHVLCSFQNRPRLVQKIHGPWQTFQGAWFKFLCLYCVVLLFLMVLVRSIAWIHYTSDMLIPGLHLMVDAHVLIHICLYSYMHSWALV